MFPWNVIGNLALGQTITVIYDSGATQTGGFLGVFNNTLLLQNAVGDTISTLYVPIREIRAITV